MASKDLPRGGGLLADEMTLEKELVFFSESSQCAVQRIGRAPTETGWLGDSWLACGVGAGPRAAPCIERGVTTLSTPARHSTRYFESDSHHDSQTWPWFHVGDSIALQSARGQ